MDNVTLHLGDCLSVMADMEPNSMDAIVTDPPYELGFMGKAWDKQGVTYRPETWEACYRVAKPGAHLLAFGGTRTWHRLACAIEDAGWEIRDTVMWVYGSGFPKSHDISKAIDREGGTEREVVGSKAGRPGYSLAPDKGRGVYSSGGRDSEAECSVTAPTSGAARQWEGWGTALKPAWEPIIVARKPVNCTIAENVLKWGTGGINVDGCRVATNNDTGRPHGTRESEGWRLHKRTEPSCGHPQGRWPANLVHDGSDEVMAGFPQRDGPWGRESESKNHTSWYSGPTDSYGKLYHESGSAARFFYCAKASKVDRDEGCEGLEATEWRTEANMTSRAEREGRGERQDAASRNCHPTVKPTALMRWLVRLVTPPEGVVLDPFMGSGSTGKAAVLEGFNFIGIEMDAEYCEIARRRIEAVRQPRLI